MSTLKSLILVGVAVAGMTGAASADPSRSATILIPGHYETRMQTVEEPGRWVEEQKVVEVAGHYETQYRKVEVPGHFEKVERQVWVPARVVGARPRFAAQVNGCCEVEVRLPLPCTEVVPAHYETRCEQVWIEGRCEQQAVQVWVPGTCRTECVRVFKPGCVHEQAVQVWMPARYEQRRVACEERDERHEARGFEGRRDAGIRVSFRGEREHGR